MYIQGNGLVKNEKVWRIKIVNGDSNSSCLSMMKLKAYFFKVNLFLTRFPTYVCEVPRNMELPGI